MGRAVLSAIGVVGPPSLSSLRFACRKRCEPPRACAALAAAGAVRAPRDTMQVTRSGKVLGAKRGARASPIAVAAPSPSVASDSASKASGYLSRDSVLGPPSPPPLMEEAVGERARIVLRVRPPLTEEEAGDSDSAALQLDAAQGLAWAFGDTSGASEVAPRQFAFDELLEAHAGQADVYEAAGAAGGAHGARRRRRRGAPVRRARLGEAAHAAERRAGAGGAARARARADLRRHERQRAVAPPRGCRRRRTRRRRRAPPAAARRRGGGARRVSDDHARPDGARPLDRRPRAPAAVAARRRPRGRAVGAPATLLDVKRVLKLGDANRPAEASSRRRGATRSSRSSWASAASSSSPRSPPPTWSAAGERGRRRG